MSHRYMTFLAAPALAVLLGTGAAHHATAQTVVTVPAYRLAQSTVIVAPTAPPPPETETVPPPPAGETTYTWQPGHWDWNGKAWVWTAGTYVQRIAPPAPSAVWVPGQWQAQPAGGFVWVAGHWQV